MSGERSDDAPACLGFRRLERRPEFRPPPGACDAHMHIFEAASLAHLVPHRSYTPKESSLADYRRMMAMAGIDRAVLVQPSVFGTDHTALLETLNAASDILRGIAVLPPEVSDDDMRRFHAAGVRGIRINRRNPGGLPLHAIELLGPRIAALGWHIQLQVNLDETAGLRELVERSPVPVVIDHFGLPNVDPGPEGSGFQLLLDLLRTDRVWVKLSSPYRISRRGPPYPDVRPFAQALVSVRPDRLLWASDWPHVELRRQMPDDATLVDLIPDWLPDPSLQSQVLVSNPEALYWSR